MSSSEMSLSRPKPREEGFMHPCEFVQRSGPQQEQALRMHRIRTTHGLGAAIEEGLTEVTLLAGGRRLGALPSSHTLHDAYRGRLTQLDVGDIYGLPENDPRVQPSSRALAEEAVFGHELTMKNMGM